MLALAAVIVVDTPTELALERLVTLRGMARDRRRGPHRLADRPGRPGWKVPTWSSTTPATTPTCRPRWTGSGPCWSGSATRSGPVAGPRPVRPGLEPDSVTPSRYHRTLPDFEVVSPFRPAGDQPEAIAGLVAGLERGDRYQTLLGITGSGKTATIAWTIEAVQRPTLIIEPNKSLAAQLAAELKEFFPHNRVEYFVSYYDYYQPEAYVPSSDTYIEKDSSINDEIDRLRHACTSSLLLRPDTIVVASVSCIYGLGSPDEYRDRIVALHPGEVHDQRALLRRLVDLQYSRNDVTLARGQFRARGDTVEIHAAYESQAVRIEFFGDTVERIRPFDVMTGEIGDELDELVVFANTHYGTGDERMRKAVVSIETELRERLGELDEAGKLLEAQRLRMRTEYDLEMLAETGVCSGVENYSRHLDGRAPGEAPFTLLDFFPKDFLVVLDESHVAVPQLRGQYAGDRSRKETLVDHGFRLPSAVDNRPLRFEEFIERTGQTILLSATPGPVGARAQRQRGRAGHPAHRAGRPRGGHPAHHRADRRPAGADRRHRGRRQPGAGHHPHQEDGRGPHRLPRRAGGPGPVPPLRRGHHGPHRDPPRAAAGHLRRPGGHQPPPRGPRPARGGAGGHPRRRQGGLPALGARRSSRPWGGRPATSTGGWSCTPTPSPTR